MVKSRTTRLDPRTHDIYVNRAGKMEIATKEEEIAQKFSILVHSNVGRTCLNERYGLDYDWIRNSGLKFHQAFFMELARKFEEKVEPILEGFSLGEITKIGHVAMINVNVRSSEGNNVNLEVNMA